MTEGRFVVFEGLDGAGTSTQIELLATWLRGQGIEVEVTREPTGGDIGRLIRRALTHEVDFAPAALALLFAADRVDHIENPAGIKAALAAGRWVLSDRYVLSSVAYQAADGLEPAWVVAINQGAICPDATIFVDTTPEVCMQRVAARGAPLERYENLARQQAVQAQFLAHLERSDLTGNLLSVDGNGSREAVAALIQAAVGGWIAAST